MKNPYVTVDLTNHHFYYDTEYGKVLTAEILILNINKSSMRVRLYDPLTNKRIMSNVDLGTCWIVDEEITINLSNT